MDNLSPSTLLGLCSLTAEEVPAADTLMQTLQATATGPSLVDYSSLLPTTPKYSWTPPMSSLPLLAGPSQET